MKYFVGWGSDGRSVLFDSTCYMQMNLDSIGKLKWLLLLSADNVQLNNVLILFNKYMEGKNVNGTYLFSILAEHPHN